MAESRLKTSPAKLSMTPHTNYPGEQIAENPSSLKHFSDAELLDMASQGHQAPMAELFDRYAHMAFAIALKILNVPDAAEVVTREAFLEIWRQPKTFRIQRCELPAWLSAFTRKRALDQLAIRNRTSDRATQLPNPDLFSLAPDQQWRLDRLKRTVNSLPAEQRQALELTWFVGHTLADAATETGQTQAKVNHYLQEAIRAFEKALGPNE